MPRICTRAPKSLRTGLALLSLACCLALAAGATRLTAAEFQPGEGLVMEKPASVQNIYKPGFTLFNPTPRAAMRDLSPDRPDTTESPNSVDAGHFQIEMSLFDFSRDRERGVTSTAWTVADANLKVGLTNATDLQVVLSSYTWEKTEGPGLATERAEGFGDVTVRFKMNLWGNDPMPGEDTAFGIMPFVKIPTGTALSNNHTEGGLIFMYGWDFTEGWDLGFMLELDAVYDETDDDTDLDWVHTVVLGHDIIGPLGIYLEYLGVAHADKDSFYQATFDAGFTYGLDDDTSLDVGIRVGLNRAAEDFGTFSGFSWRY